MAACAMLVAAVGCGEGEGVSAGATVTAYVEAPLCAEAKRELTQEGGRSGDVDVHAICLPAVRSGGDLGLARVGANARQATEDSTTVGYVSEPDPEAVRFIRPILEEAGIAQISTSSGATAMNKLLKAVDEAGDSGSLRESVRKSLEGD